MFLQTVSIQEVDEGQPCLACGDDKCPGFTPHDWRYLSLVTFASPGCLMRRSIVPVLRDTCMGHDRMGDKWLLKSVRSHAAFAFVQEYLRQVQVPERVP